MSRLVTSFSSPPSAITLTLLAPSLLFSQIGLATRLAKSALFKRRVVSNRADTTLPIQWPLNGVVSQSAVKMCLFAAFHAQFAEIVFIQGAALHECLRYLLESVAFERPQRGIYAHICGAFYAMASAICGARLLLRWTRNQNTRSTRRTKAHCFAIQRPSPSKFK